AKLAGVSSDLLRHYERIGILAKAERGANGYRRYPASALTRVRAARRALTLGFTLAELARMFAVRDGGGGPCPPVRALATEKLRRPHAELIETRRAREQLRRIVSDWDRRLRRHSTSQRANLLHSLEEHPIAAKPRANPKRRGWQR